MLTLTLHTPNGTQKFDNIDEAVLPTKNGEIAVLPNHSPVMTELSNGTIEVKLGKSIHRFVSFDGFAQITGTDINIFSAGIEEADNLNEAEIQKAIERAQATLEESREEADISAIAVNLEREMAKLKTIKRHRRQL